MLFNHTFAKFVIFLSGGGSLICIIILGFTLLVVVFSSLKFMLLVLYLFKVLHCLITFIWFYMSFGRRPRRRPPSLSLFLSLSLYIISLSISLSTSLSLSFYLSLSLSIYISLSISLVFRAEAAPAPASTPEVVS